MPRLLGVDIPNDKPTVISLTYLFGVGPRTSRDLCQKAGIDPQAKARDLIEDELGRLAALLERDYTVEGPLRRPVVDPDGADLLAPAALVQGRHDVLAGTGLGQRRARVLQVEEDLVGRQALGLLQEPGVAARDGEVGTAGSELGHGASAGRRRLVTGG